MNRESEHRQVALDFIKAARYPQSVFEFSAELECVGMRGGRIPAARANVWKSVIDQLVTDGKLVMSDRGVHGPVELDKPKQMELF
jgi:hypothetical protein